MSVTISGHQVDIGDSEGFRTHVLEGLNHLWQKHHMQPFDVQLVLSKEGNHFLCGISAKIGKNASLRCEGKGDTAYSSFDVSLTTLTQRLRRHREKLKDLHHRAGYDKTNSVPLYVLNGSEEHEATDDHAAAIIAEVKTDIPSFTVSEAVMQMDLNDDEALVFINKAKGKINMLYRRRDGHIGWIDPSAAVV